jgi:hypothetical protein
MGIPVLSFLRGMRGCGSWSQSKGFVELANFQGEQFPQGEKVLRSFRPFGEEEPGTWRTAVGAVKCTGCDVSSDRATYANVFRQARDN